jgi:hypothetical protein
MLVNLRFTACLFGKAEWHDHFSLKNDMLDCFTIKHHEGCPVYLRSKLTCLSALPKVHLVPWLRGGMLANVLRLLHVFFQRKNKHLPMRSIGMVPYVLTYENAKKETNIKILC